MDWFERLTGIREENYEETREALSVVDGRLVCAGWDTGRLVGSFEMASLADLRAAAALIVGSGAARLLIVEGDVRAMHRDPVNAGALFQVASQFNMLEMISPRVSPERGVGRYDDDPTQGPACAIAAGAATVYRNYLVPVGGGTGQNAERQLDGSLELRRGLARGMGVLEESLWTMRNGYAIPTSYSLDCISEFLEGLGEPERDELRGLLRVGLHRDVEVTDAPAPGPTVTQAFCSAMPVSYSKLHDARWEPLARLVLEAAYEATLLEGVLNARRGPSRRVLLTMLGGDSFGNDPSWILGAMGRALDIVADFGLDVAIVSYGPASGALTDFVAARRAQPQTLASRSPGMLPSATGYPNPRDQECADARRLPDDRLLHADHGRHASRQQPGARLDGGARGAGLRLVSWLRGLRRPRP
jgi:hypothetical protein